TRTKKRQPRRRYGTTSQEAATRTKRRRREPRSGHSNPEAGARAEKRRPEPRDGASEIGDQVSRKSRPTPGAALSPHIRLPILGNATTPGPANRARSRRGEERDGRPHTLGGADPSRGSSPPSRDSRPLAGSPFPDSEPQHVASALRGLILLR